MWYCSASGVTSQHTVSFEQPQPFAPVAFAETGRFARIGFGRQELRRNRLAVVLVGHHHHFLLKIHGHIVGRRQRQSVRFHRFFGESHTGVVARELRDGLVNTLIQQIFVAFKPMPHVIRTVEFQRPTVGTILFEQKYVPISCSRPPITTRCSSISLGGTVPPVSPSDDGMEGMRSMPNDSSPLPSCVSLRPKSPTFSGHRPVACSDG